MPALSASGGGTVGAPGLYEPRSSVEPRPCLLKAIGNRIRRNKEPVMQRPEKRARSQHPLVEVALVSSFPPEPAVDCLRHEFFNRIRQTYGHLVPPEWQGEIPPAFEPYRFHNADRSAAVVLGLTSFGFFTGAYSTHETFRAEALRLFELAQETFGISTLTRVGLRYTNIMRYERVDGLVPLDKFLRVGLKFPKTFPFTVDDPRLGFVIKKDETEMSVHIEPRVRQGEDADEAVFLVISHEKSGQLHADRLPEYVDEARAEARTLFKWLTLESYRKSFQED
jgi:uncharacterized protein (TIGR04255 family)